MIRCLKSGGITDTIFMDILETVDTQERGHFLFLDGHQLQFGLDFLSYITNINHTWKVYLDMSCDDAALWQMGGSPEQKSRLRLHQPKRRNG